MSQFYLGGGHTAGLAASADGTFHPFWIDNRTGVSQVWTAPISVQGKPIRNGRAELAELDDITNDVMIAYSNTHYDQATGKISVDAQVQNTSKGTITGPIKIRVTSLKSPAGGNVKILSTDNGEGGVGAIWDFGALLIDNQLKPREKSRAKHLEFEVSDLPGLEEATRVRPLFTPINVLMGWGALYLFDLEARVFGRAGPKT